MHKNDVTETEPSMLHFALCTRELRLDNEVLRGKRDSKEGTVCNVCRQSVTTIARWLMRNRETVCASMLRLIQYVLLEKSVSLRRNVSEAVSALHRIRLHYATQYRGVPTTSSVAKFVAMVFFQR